jgi:hypothetical protein
VTWMPQTIVQHPERGAPVAEPFRGKVATSATTVFSRSCVTSRAAAISDKGDQRSTNARGIFVKYPWAARKPVGYAWNGVIGAPKRRFSSVQSEIQDVSVGVRSCCSVRGVDAQVQP